MREDLKSDSWGATVKAIAKLAGQHAMGSDRMGPGSKLSWKGRRSEATQVLDAHVIEQAGAVLD